MDQFMRSAYNSIQKQNNNEELDVLKFNRLLKSKSEELNVDSDLIQRFVNHGFSSGEIIEYSASTPIQGLSTSTSYIISKFDDNSFKLTSNY